MKLIDEKLLNDLTRQAKENVRLRVNYNFHEHLEDKVQRLLNAMEPGTKPPSTGIAIRRNIFSGTRQYFSEIL
jgi:hypothetical protein